MSEFQEFPKILHIGGELTAPSRIVYSAEEEDAAEGYAEVCFFEVGGPTKEELSAQASGLGVAVDARWGVKRLLAEIAKVQ